MGESAERRLEPAMDGGRDLADEGWPHAHSRRLRGRVWRTADGRTRTRGATTVETSEIYQTTGDRTRPRNTSTAETGESKAT